MHSRVSRSRFLAIFFVVSVAAVALPYSGPIASATTPAMHEDFENPALLGWIVEGALARVDCLAGRYGCALNVSVVSPAHGEVSLSRASNVDLSRPYELAFEVRGGDASEATSTTVAFAFASGDELRFDIGGAGNAGAVTASANGAALASVALRPGEWNRIAAQVSPDDGSLVVKVESASGDALVAPLAMSFVTSATTLTMTTIARRSSDVETSLESDAIFLDRLYVGYAETPFGGILKAVNGPQVGEISLSWTPGDDGGSPITGYTLYGSNSSEPLVLLGTLGPETRSFVDSGRTPGVWRAYVVKAWNRVGEGDASSKPAIRPWGPPTAPRQLVATTDAGVGSIHLSWIYPDYSGGYGPLVRYTVYRGLANDSLSPIAELAASASSFKDTHLQNGTRYFYAVSATAPLGEGPRSRVASALPGADRIMAPTSIALGSPDVWSGDVVSATFAYDVAASACPLDAACPVPTEWRIEDGSAILASGVAPHDGHAEWATMQVSTMITPTGADGPRDLAFAARLPGGAWRVAPLSYVLHAPMPSEIRSVARPQPDAWLVEPGTTIHVRSAYSVFAKQCRASEACAVTSEWRILWDGVDAQTPPARAGANEHPAHGTTETFGIEQDVETPFAPGPHKLTVAVRADASSPWSTTSRWIIVMPGA